MTKRKRLARSDVLPLTVLHYGKQAVNLLAGLADFLDFAGRRERPAGAFGIEP
jgi:hypothetical protein